MRTVFRFLRGVAAALLVAVALPRCTDTPTQPELGTPPGSGKLVVHANVATAGIDGLVIQVSGPGIVKSGGAPDTLSFNIAIVDGVASGTIVIPAGPSRVVTARAFDGVVETHRGSVTTDIAEGINPQLALTLVPLVGDVPITVEIGTTLVIVRPAVASIAVGDTLHMSAEVRDNNGNVVNGTVRWATLNPGRATVSGTGIVTMRDTGDVQIVATYGTVGGSARLTGTGRLSEVTYQLTWNGTTSDNWLEPNNWTPHGVGAARVPTALDSVVIPAAAPTMPRLLACADTFVVRDLVVESGAKIVEYCGNGVNVYRSADVRTPIAVTVKARPGVQLKGAFGRIEVHGDSVRLAGPTSATSLQVNAATASLRLAGHALTVNGNLDVNAGTITLADPDTLVVTGNVYWGGGNQAGKLDGGVVRFRGETFNGYRYKAGGTNRLVFERPAGSQWIHGFSYTSDPGRASLNRWEVQTRDTLHVCSYVQVTDTARFTGAGTTPMVVHQSGCGGYYVRADGPVVTTANVSVENYLWELRHVTGTSLVAGAWLPNFTDLHVANAEVKPGLAYRNLRFYAANSFRGDTEMNALLLHGPGVEVAVAGHVVRVNGPLDVENGAVLAMVNAADSVLVATHATFGYNQSALQQPRTTAGLLRIGSYIYGHGFGSQGTHVLELAGLTTEGQANGQYFSGMDHSRSTNDIANMRITAGTYGVCGHARVRGGVELLGSAQLVENCGGYYLHVHGPLATAAGTSVTSYLVALYDTTGTGRVQGTFAPAHTDFSAPGARVNPALGYRNFRVFQPVTLSGRTQATGYVYVNGAAAELALGGNTMVVGNYLQVDGGATIRMQSPSDSLLVSNYATFNDNISAAQKPKITAGVMSVGAYLYGHGFAASDSGSHKVILASGGAHTDRYISGMNYESRAHQTFRHLEIAAGTTYGLCERVRATGVVTVRAGATLQDWCGSPYLRVDGDLVTEAGSTVKPYNVALSNATGTQNVSGIFTPVWTSIHTSPAAGQLKAGLGYTNMGVYVPMQLSADTDINGQLYLSGTGTTLSLNQHRLLVHGELNLDNAATVTMVNDADTLEVKGRILWDGNGPQNGKLTAGTLIARGPTFCASDFYATGTHTTVFARDSSQVQVDCVSSNAALMPFRVVKVAGSGLRLSCYLYASGNMYVQAGARVDQNCGSGALTVGDTLFTSATSLVTNGPGYPGTQHMTISLPGTAGTGQVGGDYMPHVTVFGGLNAVIRPGLEYRHMYVDRSTSFSGATTLTGGLTIRNDGTILTLGGNTVSVGAGLNLDNSALLDMTSAAGRLTVGALDPSADIFWDAGDNTGRLTAGELRFLGDRFYGPQFRASGTHRMVFANDSTGPSVSIEGHPTFARLELAGLRATSVNNRITVLDSMIVSAPTLLTSPDYVELVANGGGLVTVPGSDIAVNNIFLGDSTGTRDVQGTFRPVRTIFRSPSPGVAGAIRPGLAYGSVLVEGSYALSAATAFGGGLTVSTTSGRLDLAGQALDVTGAVEITGGGSLRMAMETDSLRTGQTFYLRSSAGVSDLSTGSVVVQGQFVNVEGDNLGITGTRFVMNAPVAGTQYIYAFGAARGLQDVEIRGASTVHLYYPTTINGSLDVLSPVTLSAGSDAHVKGALSSIAGSTISIASRLTLDDPAGTSGVGGAYSAGITHFSGAGGSQAIRTGGGMTYGHLEVMGFATTGADSLVATGNLTLGSTTRYGPDNVSLTLPSGSTVGGEIRTYGPLSFAGVARTALDLRVEAGGEARALGTALTDFVDFRNILVFGASSPRAPGVLDNSVAGDGNGGHRGNGFRFAPGNSPFYQAGSVVIGPQPIVRP